MIVTWLLALTLPVAAAGGQTTAFVDATVVPMDRERTLEHHTVVVSGGRVTAIGPTATTRPPAGATIVNAAGKFLIPGLGDAHAHLSIGGGGQGLGERAVVLAALHGVTMARSMYTEPHHVAARDRVDRGEILGPRLLLVSPPIGGQNAGTPEAARAAIQAQHAAGYRVMKVMPGLTRSAFDTLAAEARRLGVRLVGHVPADVGLSGVLAAGFASVEHLDGFLEAMVAGAAPVSAAQSGFFGLGVIASADESRIPALVAATKASGTTIVPTEFAMERFVSTDAGAALAKSSEMQYVAPALVEQWSRQKDGFAAGVGVTAERATRYRELRRRLIRDLNAAGVPIAAGSDAFNLFDVPGFGTFHEIETLTASGLTPFQALTAATVNVARLMGLETEVGTIAVGKGADLVLLDANPLGDVTALRRQAGVMLKGRWLPRADLDARLRAVAAAP